MGVLVGAVLMSSWLVAGPFAVKRRAICVVIVSFCRKKRRNVRVSCQGGINAQKTHPSIRPSKNRALLVRAKRACLLRGRVDRSCGVSVAWGGFLSGAGWSFRGRAFGIGMFLWDRVKKRDGGIGTAFGRFALHSSTGGRWRGEVLLSAGRVVVGAFKVGRPGWASGSRRMGVVCCGWAGAQRRKRAVSAALGRVAAGVSGAIAALGRVAAGLSAASAACVRSVGGGRLLARGVVACCRLRSRTCWVGGRCGRGSGFGRSFAPRPVFFGPGGIGPFRWDFRFRTGVSGVFFASGVFRGGSAGLRFFAVICVLLFCVFGALW